MHENRSLRMPVDLCQEVEEFRFSNRVRSLNSALLMLVRAGLDAKAAEIAAQQKDAT
jgi:hypothetical protein